METYTVFYGRDGAPRSGVVVALTPQGHRTLAHINVGEAKDLAFFTSGASEPVHTAGTIKADAEGRRIWVIA